jgi:hypothetical protein
VKIIARPSSKARRRSPRSFPGGGRIFERMFTRLGCHGRTPQFAVEFYPYASLCHTIRLRGDSAFVRVSDLLRQAPLHVLEAAAALLLSRIFQRPVPPELAEVYRRYSSASGTRRRMHALRRNRGRRRHFGPQGDAHHLEEIFRRLNADYFDSRLQVPEMGWSARTWRRQLGVFDPGLNHIVINRRLDREQVPGLAVAYVMFHEMLHLQQSTGRSRCGLGVHSPEFRRAEKRFREFDQARRFLARL